MSTPPKVRKGQAPAKLEREAFLARFGASFRDPRFDAERPAIARIAEIAWHNYRDARKAPHTVKAGAEFADPSYELSAEWLEARNRIRAAEARQRDAASASRILLIVGSPRNDGSCPGENSKSFTLARVVDSVLAREGIEVDLLDLSLLTSGYAQRIHPCKGCVSTAMPLCHWPCSCYPNHSLGQTNDWMAEIYERWTAAHGIVICTPVHWYQSPSTLKLMMDRLVCADGGNPDPTTTHGKDAEKAKALELAGWDYPKHLAGRVYGLVIHGDVAGVEVTRRNMADWLDWMGLIDAGNQARLDRYIGYYEPYASSHDSLERDLAVQEEARNVARAVIVAVAESRAGRLSNPGAKLRNPRQK